MEKEEKYFVQDPELIIQIVLNELIDEIELKDSFKEIFNDFNLIMVLPMESSYLILFERLRKRVIIISHCMKYTWVANKSGRINEKGRNGCHIASVIPESST